MYVHILCARSHKNEIALSDLLVLLLPFSLLLLYHANRSNSVDRLSYLVPSATGHSLSNAVENQILVSKQPRFPQSLLPADQTPAAYRTVNTTVSVDSCGNDGNGIASDGRGRNAMYERTHGRVGLAYLSDTHACGRAINKQ